MQMASHITHRCHIVHPVTPLNALVFTLVYRPTQCSCVSRLLGNHLLHLQSPYFLNHKCTSHSCGSNLGWPTPSGECAWPPLCPLKPPPWHPQGSHIYGPECWPQPIKAAPSGLGLRRSASPNWTYYRLQDNVLGIYGTVVHRLLSNEHGSVQCTVLNTHIYNSFSSVILFKEPPWAAFMKGPCKHQCYVVDLMNVISIYVP